jgi:hypothetical protein
MGEREKFAVIIPDRGDRPQFTEHCFNMLGRMNSFLGKIYHINWAPVDDKIDLVERVYAGVKMAEADGFDVVFVVENDDFYPADYFKNHLPLNGDIFGDEKTTYYHLKSRTYKHIDHPGRASLFTTGFRISAFEGFQWSGDQFLDLRLWSWAARKGLEMKFARTGAIGIKHGVGKCGGKGHKMKFPTNDPTMSWLRYRVDHESYEFYRNLSQTL